MFINTIMILDNNIKLNKTCYLYKINKLEMIEKKIRNNI